METEGIEAALRFASFVCFANLRIVCPFCCAKDGQWGSIPSDHLWIQIKTADNLSTAFILGGDRGDRSGAALCFVRLLRKPSALYVGCGSALRQTAATSTMGFDPLRPFMDTNKDSGQSVHCLYSWWRQRGSNPRPHGCEPCALTS